MTSKLLIDSEAISRILKRIAHQILETSNGIEKLGIVGIRTRGVYLGQRIVSIINQLEGCDLSFGILDITLYRDDLSHRKEQPVVKKTEIDFCVDRMRIVLVDDILFTGRTIRAAMDGIMDFGRPDSIKLAVLVDRGHRELPVRADFVGMDIYTTRDETVKLSMREEGEEDKVVSIP